MTTTDYLQREIRRAELSIRRAKCKPNTPPEELRELRCSLAQALRVLGAYARAHIAEDPQCASRPRDRRS